METSVATGTLAVSVTVPADVKRPGNTRLRVLSDALVPHPALEVRVLWGEDVLVHHQLREGGQARIGGPGSLVSLPLSGLGEVLDGEGFVFARLKTGVSVVHMPAGARGFRRRADGIPELVRGPAELVVQQGEELRMLLGAFTLVATPTEHREATAGVRWRRLAPVAFGITVGALLLFVAASTIADIPETDVRATDERHRDAVRHVVVLVGPSAPGGLADEVAGAPMVDGDLSSQEPVADLCADDVAMCHGVGRGLAQGGVTVPEQREEPARFAPYAGAVGVLALVGAGWVRLRRRRW